jgi:hypothetical protein
MLKVFVLALFVNYSSLLVLRASQIQTSAFFFHFDTTPDDDTLIKARGDFFLKPNQALKWPHSIADI